MYGEQDTQAKFLTRGEPRAFLVCEPLAVHPRLVRLLRVSTPERTHEWIPIGSQVNQPCTILFNVQYGIACCLTRVCNIQVL